MNTPDVRSTESSKLAGRSRAPQMMGCLIGVVMGAIIAIAAMRWLSADPTPTLTPERFDQVWEQWKRSPVENYDVQIRVSGTQGAVYEVQVRDGSAVSARRNGEPLLQRRTFETWSVGGMLSTISRDVENLRAWNEHRAKPGTPEVALRAEFDPTYGYPLRYRRIQFGSTVEVAWEVEKFAIVSPTSPSE